MKILGRGVYSVSEAAQLTGLDQNKIRRWFRRAEGTRLIEPMFQGDYAEYSNGISFSFYDLIELNVCGQFRRDGFSLQYLRRVHTKLKDRWQTRHPFCMKQLATDGQKIFAMEFREDESPVVYDIETFQTWFGNMIVPFLRRVDYDEDTSIALRWHIQESVVVDPGICFGKPSIEGTGVSTRVLASAFAANDRDAELVSQWFGVSPDHVNAAVKFETERGRNAA